MCFSGIERKTPEKVDKIFLNQHNKFQMLVKIPQKSPFVVAKGLYFDISGL